MTKPPLCQHLQEENEYSIFVEKLAIFAHITGIYRA